MYSRYKAWKFNEEWSQNHYKDMKITEEHNHWKAMRKTGMFE